MKCPKCKTSESTKDGSVKGRQRYCCKNCNYRYSVEQKSDVKTVETRRPALAMYLEGMGFRAIGRVLKISYGTVFRWVKEWEQTTVLPKSEKPVEVVELDEMHSYIGKKNYCWIWIAVDRFRKRRLSFVCGDRSRQTGLRLWNTLKDVNVGVFCSDYWKSYTEFLPKEKRLQSKAETYTVEGYNSRVRHYLARFKRKGKCYSKAAYRVEYSLNLLFLKLNNELAILI